MFKNHHVLGFCLTLVLFMAGFSGAHAASIVIDTFDEGDQLAPPISDIATSSAIGGRRILDADGEAQGAVSDGFLTAFNSPLPGGVITTEWNGGGTLGGGDLTAGGDFFAIDVALIAGPEEVIANELRLFVTDSDNNQSSASVFYGDLSILEPNLIPFSSLAGGADLTSVDIIRLELEVLTTSTSISIDSIQVVSAIPVPAAAWLFGSGLLGLIGIARRKRAA